MNTFFRLLCVSTCVVLLTQAGFYFTEKLTFQQSAHGDYFSNRSSEVHLADVKNAYQKSNVIFDDVSSRDSKKKTDVEQFRHCVFTTPSTPVFSPVLLQEVAWMGSEKDVHNEWIRLKKNIVGDVDLSGWQIVTESGSFIIVISDGTMLRDLNPDVIFERGKHYTGSLRNNEEGIRLFDSHCVLIDEVFAHPTWPAGNNDKKITMKRGLDLRWFDDESLLFIASSSVRGTTTTIQPLLPNNSLENETTTSTDEFFDSGASKNVDEVITNDDFSRVVIVAIMAGGEADAQQEYVTIRNEGDNLVDMAGWALKKKTASGTEYSLVSSKAFRGAIAAHSELTIAHRDYIGNADVRYSNNSNSLAYENNSVVLIDSHGRIVEEVSYGSLQKGEVWRQ